MSLDINLILNSVKSIPKETLSEIKEEREQKLHEFYDKFLDIKKNKTNLENAKKILENYRYIEYDDIEKGDFVKYISDKYFYDIEVKGGGTVIEKKNGNCLLKAVSIWTAKSKVFFKKISNEDMAKLFMIDVLNKEKLNI